MAAIRATQWSLLPIVILLWITVTTKLVSGWIPTQTPTRTQRLATHFEANVIFTRLNEDCLRSLEVARQTALQHQQSSIDIPCLMAGVCNSNHAVIDRTLEHFMLNATKLMDVVGYLAPKPSSVPKLSDFNTNVDEDLLYTDELQTKLFEAGQISKTMGSDGIQLAHLFLSMLQYQEVNGEPQAATRSDDCPAMEMLYHLDATLEGEDLCFVLLQNLMQEQQQQQSNPSKDRPSGSIQRQSSSKTTPVQNDDKDRAAARSLLAECGTDLTAAADAGLLDPVYGRNDTIQNCFQTLLRRRKNNVCLIGEAGVGKTSIAEGIAQVLVSEDCPVFLRGYRVIALEVAALTAGTKYRGEFETRLKDIIEELISSTKKTILFIDEIHTIVGAGAVGESAMDASNILKPYLSRGQLQVMGATTITEYNNHISKDAALERRFQPILVEEPSVEKTVEILEAILPFYRSHHRVEYTRGSLEAAARLTDRFIADRSLPDKAIDILDEAGALATLKRIPDSIEPPTVDESSISDLISQWTNIPAGKLNLDEMERLQQLEDQMRLRVKGQDRAIKTVSKAIRRARTGIRNPRRPIASLLFSGPTGTGKTELCKTLADTYYGSERDLIKIDMSEYMDKSSITRLTGPPPGFVGYENGGQLTESVRRAPHSVVLLDELEKASVDVLNVLLQVMEDGILTDGKGRSVSFKNTILIMTSNIGSEKLLEMAQSSAEKPEYTDMAKSVFRDLHKHLSPEFVNRIDDVVVFEPLSNKDLKLICSVMVVDIAVRARLERNIDITTTDAFVTHLVQDGAKTSSQFGARPLRRTVQRILEDAISDSVVQGFLLENDTAVFDIQDNQIVICRERDDGNLCMPIDSNERDMLLDFEVLQEDSDHDKQQILNGDSEKEPAYSRC